MFIRAVVFIKIFILKAFCSVHFLLNILVHSPSSRTKPGCYYMVLPEIISTWYFRFLMIYSTSFFLVLSSLPFTFLFPFVQVAYSQIFYKKIQNDTVEWLCSQSFALLAVAVCKAYQEQQTCCQLPTFTLCSHKQHMLEKQVPHRQNAFPWG